MKYDGYVIKVEPDYKEMISNGDEIEELYCEVYDEKDVDMKNCLLDFNMMQCFEYDENTVESIEMGIKRMVENEYSFLQLSKKEQVFNRQSELFYRAIEFLKVSQGEDVRRTLSINLGMTDEEIDDALSDQDMEQDEGMKLM